MKESIRVFIAEDNRLLREGLVVLLGEHSFLKVMTLSAECDEAFLYQSSVPKKRIDQPSEQTVLDEIRESMHQHLADPRVTKSG